MTLMVINTKEKINNNELNLKNIFFESIGKAKGFNINKNSYLIINQKNKSIIKKTNKKLTFYL